MIRRILLFLTLCVLAGLPAAHAQSSQCIGFNYTPNLKLGLPPIQTPGPGWANCINSNFTTLDTLLSGNLTLAQNSVTPTVAGSFIWVTNNSSPTTITNLTGGFAGQRITIIAGDTNTTIVSNANFKLASAWASSSSSTLTLVLYGNVWTEVSRYGATGGGGGGAILETNGVTNADQTILNFTNPANYNGLTFTWLNPSGGQETFAVGGSLAYSSLSGAPTLPASAGPTAHQWFSAYNATTGLFTLSQPSYSDLNGVPTLYNQTLQSNGTGLTQRPAFNLIPGSGIQISCTDNAVSQRTDCTVTSTSGGGTVTSFSALNLTPLFTTSVSTPTSTPQLSFTLSNAAANTVFANCTGSFGAPNYCSITNGMLPTTMTGITIDGVTPTTMGFVDPTSSIQTQLNGKAASNAATTVSGVSCALGGSCTVPYSGLSGLPTLYNQTLQDNGVALTQRPAFNLIPGTGMTISCSDNGVSQRTDCTLTSTAAPGVTSISGDGALYTNASSTGAVTLTLGTAVAHAMWGNHTGATATPTYAALSVADLPTGIPNANLSNSSITINPPTTMTGWGAVSLGGTLSPTWSITGADYLFTSTAANTPAWEQINGGLSCGDATHALSYSTVTHTVGCQTLTTTSLSLQTNGVSNSNQTILNFVNPSSFNGLTFTFNNPTSGNETFAVGGTLSNSGLANPSTTVNNQTCTLGSNCTVSGGENTQTTSYTLTAADLGRNVVMNCTTACTVTLYGSPTNGYYGAIESIGSTVATVSLNTKNFNGSTAVPILRSYRPLEFWSDGTNYIGTAPEVAGTGITFTPASNGITISLTNTATTVNGQTCTLGSTCTIPFQTNSVNNTSQAGLNLIPGTGITLTNGASNQVTIAATGGTITASPQFEIPDYSAAGTTSTLTGLPWLTGYDGVPQTLTETTSAGSPTAPVAAISGVVVNAQTGTTYTFTAADRNKWVTFNNAASIAVTLPQAGSAGFDAGYLVHACDIGAGTATTTPTTSTISYTNGSAYTSGATSLALTTGQCATILDDATGTNYTGSVYAGGSSGLSGMTAGQIPIAATASTVTSSKAIQGTDTSLLSSGTVSGTGATLCTDASGGATTTGCSSGGSTAFSSLTPSTANLTLNQAGFTSEFDATSAVANFFKYANITAATSSVSQSSPLLSLCGQEWAGGTPGNAQGCFTLQFVAANGSNTSALLSAAYSGSSTATTQGFSAPIVYGVNFVNIGSPTSATTSLGATLGMGNSGAVRFSNGGNWSTSTPDSSLYRIGAGLLGVGAGGTSGTGLFSSGDNVAQTGSSYTNATTTPSTFQSWTLPAVAHNYSYRCDLVYQSTATTDSLALSVNSSVAPTSEMAHARIFSTLTGTSTDATVTSTSSGNVAVLTGAAPNAATTNYEATMYGTIEEPAAGGTFSIQAASSAAGTITILRGSTCYIHP